MRTRAWTPRYQQSGVLPGESLGDAIRRYVSWIVLAREQLDHGGDRRQVHRDLTGCAETLATLSLEVDALEGEREVTTVAPLEGAPPGATPWKDAERRLFGEPNVHYELNDASMADLLRKSICTHTGEDTVTDALEHLANELSMVTLGIERAPDTAPVITCSALSGIERRLRVVKTIAARIQHLADNAPARAGGTS